MRIENVPSAAAPSTVCMLTSTSLLRSHQLPPCELVDTRTAADSADTIGAIKLFCVIPSDGAHATQYEPTGELGARRTDGMLCWSQKNGVPNPETVAQAR